MNIYARALFFALILIPTASAASCPKNVYYLTQGYSFASDNLIFDYLDMDLSKSGPQNIVKVPPGEITTAEISWRWGVRCPDCIVHINALGDWVPGSSIMRLYSGPKGEFPSEPKIPISFPAPDIPGEYKFRVIIAYDREHALDFDASNLCSEAECQARGECNILIAEGEINVTTLSDVGTIPLSVELTSPKTTEVSGIFSANVGAVIPINADITTPPNTTANVTIEIDDKEVSGFLPFSWNTFNETEGTHWIVVVAKDENGSLAYDEIEVSLQNKSEEYGIIPPLLWKQRIKGKVNDVDISEKGTYVVAGSNHGYAYLFDKSSKRVWERDLLAPVDSVSTDALGERLLFASGTVLYYLNANGELIWNYSSPTRINSVDINSDGSKIAFASENVLYYLSGNGSLSWTYSTSNSINSIAINSAGDRVASASGNVLYYFSEGGTLDWTYSSTTEINSVAMNREGTRIAFSSGEVLYYMDNLASLLWNLTEISDVALSTDGSLLLAKSGDALLTINNRGAVLWKEITENDIGIISVSSDGKFLVYSEDDSIFLKSNTPVAVVEQSREWMYGIAALLAILALLIFVRVKGAPPVLRKLGMGKAAVEAEGEEAAVVQAEVATLKVIVKNSKTKRPIKGAKALCGNKVVYTDENGEATWENVPFGEQTITIEKESYQPWQEARVVGEGENTVEMALVSQAGTTGKDEEILKGIVYNLSKEYESVSNHDTCLPNYYKSIGQRIVEFLETLSYSPEFLETESRDELLDSFIEAGSIACNGIRDVISDWRNVKLYQAASKLEKSECEAKEIDFEKLRASLTNPEGLRHEIERRLTELDKKMMDQMNELTIIPVSTLWQVSKDLVRESLATSGYRKLSMLFFASVLTEYTDNMLEDEEILKRLKFAIL
jgi:hypothetical protein